MTQNRNRDLDKIQSDEYQFPYHYIPNHSGFPNFSKNWNFSPSYLAAIQLAQNWLHSVLDEITDEMRHIDIGCGDGGFVFILNQVFGDQNIKFTGIDYDKSAISWATIFSTKNTKFDCIKLQELDEESFHSASLVEVLEHVPPEEVPSFVEDIHRVLKPGGQLFLTVPSIEKPLISKHYQHFDFDSIQAIIGKQFDVEICEGFERRTKLINFFMRLCFGRKHYFEHAGLNKFLINKFGQTHKTIDKCGRLRLIARKK